MSTPALDDDLALLRHRFDWPEAPGGGLFSQAFLDVLATDRQTHQPVRLLAAAGFIKNLANPPAPGSGVPPLVRLLHELALARRASHPGIPDVHFATAQPEGLAAVLSVFQGPSLEEYY